MYIDIYIYVYTIYIDYKPLFMIVDLRFYHYSKGDIDTDIDIPITCNYIAG